MRWGVRAAVADRMELRPCSCCLNIRCHLSTNNIQHPTFSHFLICLSKMFVNKNILCHLLPTTSSFSSTFSQEGSDPIFLFQAPSSSIAMNGFLNGYKHCGLRWNYWPYTITHSALTMNVLPLAVNAHKRSILWENNIVDTYIYIAAL